MNANSSRRNAIPAIAIVAALALEEVVKQLMELYDVDVSVEDADYALRPGEVVSNAI